MKLCPQLNPPSAHRQPGGFTIIELVVLIALMGVLITVIVVSVGSQPATIRNIKLGADVATLNQLVSAYVADGGNLAGLTSPQTVLDRLKKGRPQTEWQRHTGATSGKLADVRLRARTTTTPSTEGLERAKWNTRTMHFEMTTGTGTAVSEFYLDDTLSTTDFGTDTRAAPNVKFNTSSRGWVWASASSPAFTYATPGASTGPGVNHPFDPTETVPVPPTPPDSGGGSGGGGGGGGGSGGGGSTTPAPTKLPTPLISPSGGTFAYAAFPSLITVSGNGAPSGSSSVLQYRINGGAWISYSGPVTIASSNLLQARNATLDVTVYYNSNTASATYYRLTEGFTGSHTGTWGNATGGADLVTTTLNGATTSTFKHGNTKLDLGNGEFLDAGVENVLTFQTAPFADVTANTWFDLGNVVMLNGTTFYNSEADGVTLSINLSMSEPAQTGVVHVNFGLISTENSSDRLASADIVELRNPNSDFSVTIDGVAYRLELTWVTLDPGAGVVQGNQFLVFEGASAQAELRGRFVSNH